MIILFPLQTFLCLQIVLKRHIYFAFKSRWVMQISPFVGTDFGASVSFKTVT